MKLRIGLLFILNIVLGNEGKFSLRKAVLGKISLYRNAPSYGAQVQN
jgi:hypothetical protein